MDYSNSKIYKILNYETDDVYVGSTVQPLCKRLFKHKSNSVYRVNCKAPFYEVMRHIGHDRFYTELIELYPCKSKEELRAREGHFIRECGTLNKQVAGRSLPEYTTYNREYLNKQAQEWKLNNESKVNEYRAKYLAKQSTKEY